MASETEPHYMSKKLMIESKAMGTIVWTVSTAKWDLFSIDDRLAVYTHTDEDLWLEVDYSDVADSGYLHQVRATNGTLTITIQAPGPVKIDPNVRVYNAGDMRGQKCGYVDSYGYPHMAYARSGTMYHVWTNSTGLWWNQTMGLVRSPGHQTVLTGYKNASGEYLFGLNRRNGGSDAVCIYGRMNAHGYVATWYGPVRINTSINYCPSSALANSTGWVHVVGPDDNTVQYWGYVSRYGYTGSWTGQQVGWPSTFYQTEGSLALWQSGVISARQNKANKAEVYVTNYTGGVWHTPSQRIVTDKITTGSRDYDICGNATYLFVPYSRAAGQLWATQFVGGSWSAVYQIPNTPAGMATPYDIRCQMDSWGQVHVAVRDSSSKLHYGWLPNMTGAWNWTTLLPGYANREGRLNLFVRQGKVWVFYGNTTGEWVWYGSYRQVPESIWVDNTCSPGSPIYVGDIYNASYYSPSAWQKRVAIYHGGSILHVSPTVTYQLWSYPFSNLPTGGPTGYHEACLQNWTGAVWVNLTNATFYVLPRSALWVAWVRDMYNYQSILVGDAGNLRCNEYHKEVDLSCGEWYMEMWNGTSLWSNTVYRISPGMPAHKWFSWDMPWTRPILTYWNYSVGEIYGVRLIRYYPSRAAPITSWTWDWRNSTVKRESFTIIPRWYFPVIARGKTNYVEYLISGYPFTYMATYGKSPMLNMTITNIRTGDTRTYRVALPSMSYSTTSDVDVVLNSVGIYSTGESKGTGSTVYNHDVMITSRIPIKFQTSDDYRIVVGVGNSSTIDDWAVVYDETIYVSGRMYLDSVAKSFVGFWGVSPEILEIMLVIGLFVTGLGLCSWLWPEMSADAIAIAGLALLAMFYLFGWVNLLAVTLACLVFVAYMALRRGGVTT